MKAHLSPGEPFLFVRIFSVTPRDGSGIAVIVHKEVSQGVDGVVVDSVFDGQFVRAALFGIMVTTKGLDEPGTARGDDKFRLAVAGFNGAANQLDAFED